MSGELVTEVIYKCLMPCPECTGRYTSNILGKRFICHCPCHHHHDKLVTYPKREGENEETT